MGVKEQILETGDALQKYIILLAYANNEPINGRIKLQKIMFLLSHIIDEVGNSSYEADNYGPYSEMVDEELGYLEQAGVLSAGAGKIELTKVGRQIAEVFVKKEDEDILMVLEGHKELLNDLSTKELLAYVFLTHPDMAEESPEYEKLKPRMDDYVMSLIKKEKISAERAAELLHKSLNYVIDRMNERRMVVLN